MGEFSIMHWLVVAAIVILVFGAKRLPEMGAAMGKGIREFKRNMSGTEEELEQGRPSSPASSHGVRSLQEPASESREPKRLH